MTLTLPGIANLTSRSCYYCGAAPSQVLKVPITSHRGPGGTRYIHEHAYSNIDRIDNSCGYEQWNVIPSCHDCQVAKGNRTLAESSHWIECLYGRLPELRSGFLSDQCPELKRSDEERKTPWPRGLKTARYRAIKLVFQHMKQNARNRNIPFSITESDVEVFMFQSCSYCGAGLSCSKRIPVLRKGEPIAYRKETIEYNSIDRVDNNREYDRDNITSACRACQIAKNNLTLKDFFALVDRLGRNLENIRKIEGIQRRNRMTALHS